MYTSFDTSERALSPVSKALGVGVVALAGSALASAYLAAKAESDNPPIGRFVEVDGVRLHYVEMGAGEPVVFLHGNGAMIQDLASSGLLDRAAQSCRVVAFDRPGFGYSERPGDRSWTPDAQAELFHKAFAQLSIAKPVVVAHSWGTLVAMRLAIAHPESVARLVLLSGYYFPTLRADTVTSAPGAAPLLGPVVQHTVGPFLSRLAANSVFKKLFKPLPVSKKFLAQYSVALASRPGQLQAVAAETAMMTSQVSGLEDAYAALRMPVHIFAGDSDAIVDTAYQSEELHKLVDGSTLHVEPGVGHMIHHAIPDKIAAVSSTLSNKTSAEAA